LSKIEYEDSFVKAASLLGGEECVKIGRALLNNENVTDEEIASATGLKINVVRKALYGLFARALIAGIRVKDKKKGWYVYKWNVRKDRAEIFIESQRRLVLEKLKQRLEYEGSNEFYGCGTLGCEKKTFLRAMESMFRCTSCGKQVSLIKEDEFVEALKWKILQIEQEQKGWQ